MSDKLPFMPLYVNDYLSDTTYLTCKEHGAYLLLLFGMWKNSGSLPCDDVALSRIARLTLKEWKQIRSNVIPFFIESGAVLTHKRVTGEILKIEKLKLTRSEVGRRGGNAKSLKSQDPPVAIATSLPEQTPSKKVPSQSSEFMGNKPLAAEPTVQPPAQGDGRAALCVKLGQRITDLMGVTNDPKWLGNWSSVSVWIAQGYDPDLDIWPTVSAMVERMKRANRKMPGSLKYFESAIAENYKNRTANGAAPAINHDLVTVKKGTAQFKAWIAHYKKLGRKTGFSETQEILTVKSEWPPSEEAA